MKTHRTYHIGIDYFAASGDRVTSVQLLRDGYGIACVDFRGGRVERNYRLPDISARAFERGARRAMRKSTPARY